MYLLDHDIDGTPVLHGPFERIVLDSVTVDAYTGDDLFILLCYSKETGAGRFYVRSIEIVTGENLHPDE